MLSRSRGFTIAEVFAALLVMAVGIIGIAALYSDQVQTNPEAQLHREAAALAEQIAKRIRETKEGHAGFATTIGVLCEQQPKPKLPQDVAAREAACWEDEVERKLPERPRHDHARHAHEPADVRDRSELVGAGRRHRVVCDASSAAVGRASGLTPIAPDSQLARQAEDHVLRLTEHVDRRGAAPLANARDDALDQHFRRRRAGGHADRSACSSNHSRCRSSGPSIR